jgi:hypothetical protein
MGPTYRFNLNARLAKSFLTQIIGKPWLKNLNFMFEIVYSNVADPGYLYRIPTPAPYLFSSHLRSKNNKKEQG